MAAGRTAGRSPPRRGSGSRNRPSGGPPYPDLFRDDAPTLPRSLRGAVLVPSGNPLEDSLPVRGERNREPFLAAGGGPDPVVRLGPKQADRGRSGRPPGPLSGRETGRADLHGDLHLGRRR